jgi:Lrp/AsnC family transcriptional regulator for asnA, asnC and gidA
MGGRKLAGASATTHGTEGVLSYRPEHQRLGRVKLDDVDHVIIRELQEDAKTPLKVIATRCQSSIATVRRRIARLRKNDVIRIVAVADPFKQGFPVVAILNMKIDQRQMDAVKAALAEVQELRFVGMTVGAYDIAAEAWFHSTEEMLGFTTQLVRQVPGIIRAEPLQILEMITYAYDWGKRRATSGDAAVAQVARRRNQRSLARLSSS